MKCPVCASAHLVQDTRDLAYTYQGQSTVVPGVSGAFCPACGDGLFERADSSRAGVVLSNC